MHKKKPSTGSLTFKGLELWEGLESKEDSFQMLHLCVLLLDHGGRVSQGELLLIYAPGIEPHNYLG